MISIADKTKCCGCSACFNICPKNAISMEYDSEGFLYPKIDNDKCIKCGLCLKVCPINAAEDLKIRRLEDLQQTQQNTKTKNKVLEVYATKNKNIEEQLKSSSGGMFSIFANYVLEQNGIVFGASFDSNWSVVHKYIDKKEDLDDLRRSKYVQSDINITYKQAKQFLDDNKLVLFTGTPCQIAGLKSFLQKDYENLLTVDIICFQVASPLVWENFLQENFDINEIKQIDFRDKLYGWDKSIMSLFLKSNKKYPKLPVIYNLLPKRIKFSLRASNYALSYRKGCLDGLFSRPSCHNCYFKGDRNSDFTIGDLWGVNNILPNMYDKKGVSVLTINSSKGKQIFEKVKNNIEYEKINYDDMIKYNPAFVTSAPVHTNRYEFFKRYKNENLNKLIPPLINEKPLVVKIFKKIINKILKRKLIKNKINLHIENDKIKKEKKINNKKAILIVSVHLRIGGIEKALISFLHKIPKEEYDVTLMLFQKEGEFMKYVPEYIKIITPPFKIGMNANLGLKYLINEKLKQKKFFTVLNLYMGALLEKLFDWSYLLRILLFEKQSFRYDTIFNFWGQTKMLIPIICKDLYQSNNKYIFLHDERRISKKNKRYYSNYDLLFCVSKELTKKAKKIYKNISDKITTLHNFIDVNNILLLSKEISFKDNFNGCRILSVGRLDYVKGFDIVIKSCKILLDKGYDIKWYIVGDGPEKENLISLIKENNLDDRFILLGERVNPYPFFKECDIYVQPSRIDAYCLTLTEAKIFNKPIVATLFMGSKEQLNDNENAIIVETTPEGIAVGVQKLLDNKDLREKLINNLKEENKKPRPDYFAELKKYL